MEVKMDIKRTQVFGFEASLHGMRNPLDSWDKSDSYCFDYNDKFGTYDKIKLAIMIEELPYNFDEQKYGYHNNIEYFVLGEKDKELARKLIKAGSEHCKFLRQIQVWVDLTLPRYIWSEFDTYRYNTKNSCSTMHTLHRRELTQDDFEQPIPEATLNDLNMIIRMRKNKLMDSNDFIHTIKNRLPEGFLQMRTVNTNYAELANIYNQRKNHRLSQWHTICEWIEDLPYFRELVLGE